MRIGAEDRAAIPIPVLGLSRCLRYSLRQATTARLHSFHHLRKSRRLTLPLHTNANRLTGLLLYLFAPILNSCMGSCLLIVLCCVAAFAAVQELTIVCSPMPSAESTNMRKP